MRVTGAGLDNDESIVVETRCAETGAGGQTKHLTSDCFTAAASTFGTVGTGCGAGVTGPGTIGLALGGGVWWVCKPTGRVTTGSTCSCCLAFGAWLCF